MRTNLAPCLYMYKDIREEIITFACFLKNSHWKNIKNARIFVCKLIVYKMMVWCLGIPTHTHTNHYHTHTQAYYIPTCLNGTTTKEVLVKPQVLIS